ncbi:hypothetical protein BT67DRAFT_256193 [Trichocladium antarcticum]|uniref:KOW domain-containing protein n=1 Tax=Trichocladium antarcticum TaxID=1450529 RepID=A0AAN6ZF51_9PEZI|nr:hypothetical protein BT67DRAFT_256193 [Trichocladium antarcticum]
MDKILRRVSMAERQVARRNKYRQQRIFSIEKNKRLQEMVSMRRQAGYELGAAVKARHEDLELGDLAPRRDVSKLDSFGNYWGSISTERAMLQVNLTDEQKKARGAWCGGSQYLCIAPGDRVVITEGPYKGKISTIESVKRDTMAVELGGNVSIVNAKIPDFMNEEGKPPVQQIKSVVPISAIRLVHPLADPETGATRDVIIRELKPVGIMHDRPTRRVTYGRVVPGLNVRIPWPRRERKVHEDNADDTLRLEVEERTFVPTLLRPPVPESVVDELRNRYSKFRTRHTPEYVARIEAEEAAKRARKKGAVDEMLLPVQEYNREMRALRRERGKPQLSEEMLDKIGEVVAKSRVFRNSKGAEAGAAPAAAAAEAEVETLHEAVEQLSLGEDAPGTAAGENQPKTSA